MHKSGQIFCMTSLQEHSSPHSTCLPPLFLARGTEVPARHLRSSEVQGHLVSFNSTSLFWLLLLNHPADRFMHLNIICAGSAKQFLTLADWQTIRP